MWIRTYQNEAIVSCINIKKDDIENISVVTHNYETRTDFNKIVIYPFIAFIIEWNSKSLVLFYRYRYEKDETELSEIIDNIINHIQYDKNLNVNKFDTVLKETLNDNPNYYSELGNDIVIKFIKKQYLEPGKATAFNYFNIFGNVVNNDNKMNEGE